MGKTYRNRSDSTGNKKRNKFKDIEFGREKKEELINLIRGKYDKRETEEVQKKTNSW